MLARSLKKFSTDMRTPPSIVVVPMVHPMLATYTANAAAAITAVITGTIQCLAALTNAEHDQLDNNNGCCKCHRLNVYHISKNCPNGFPDAAMYTGLINHPFIHHHCPHQLLQMLLSTSPPILSLAQAPGILHPGTGPKLDLLLQLDHGVDDTAATFPSVLPALGEGSDTEDDENDEVSAPFCTPHLWWKGTIASPLLSICCSTMVLMSYSFTQT